MQICDALLKTTLETLQDYFCKYKVNIENPQEVSPSILNEYKHMLGVIRTVSQGLETLTKQLSISINNLKTQKAQGLISIEKKSELIIIDKGKPKTVAAPVIEVNKDITPLAFKLLSTNLTKGDSEDFNRLLNSITETFPVLSVKINNVVANRELFEYSLALYWKMIKQPNNYIKYTEKQMIVGIPDFLPYKYPIKGEMFKKIKGNAEEENDKKTCFYYKSKILHNEIVRIVKKIQGTSAKLFNNKEHAKTDVDKKEPRTFAMIKNEISIKLSLYKIHFLSTCVYKFMTSDVFELQAVNDSLSVKLDEFEKRRLQLEYLIHWEKAILS